MSALASLHIPCMLLMQNVVSSKQNCELSYILINFCTPSLSGSLPKKNPFHFFFNFSSAVKDKRVFLQVDVAALKVRDMHIVTAKY